MFYHNLIQYELVTVPSVAEYKKMMNIRVVILAVLLVIIGAMFSSSNAAVVPVKAARDVMPVIGKVELLDNASYEVSSYTQRRTGIKIRATAITSRKGPDNQTS